MGITGLIPFMGKASKRGNIRQFSGKTVAIDAYCWLHKGAFSCADKIALGESTDRYVTYCMKFVHMLLANGIKPILVFDGRHLPAKKETEVKRRENRDANRRRAAELMQMGQRREAYNLLTRSIDISHEMALEVIKQCHKENVDCIVAPYEADAQLAYLNVCGIADVIITEDSDLTLFGCKKIFFKMDINGDGILVEQDRLHLTMNLRPEQFTMEKFRHMCILSGCDYLSSLPGIGLGKACKFILRNTEEDIHKALTRLGSHLKMKGLIVTEEYRDSFIRALVTFKHQLVYCPLRKKQVRLYPPGPEVTEEQLKFAGVEVSEDVAFQLALGNYDPFTMRKLHNFDPDSDRKFVRRTNSWHDVPSNAFPSIWSKDYKVLGEIQENDKPNEITKWPNTTGQVVTINTDALKQKATPKKRNFAEMAEELSTKEILAMYANNKVAKNENVNDRKTPPSSPSPKKEMANNEEESLMSSRRSNPFCKTSNDTEVSPSIVCRGKRRIKLKNLIGFRQTVINENDVQTSKYFSQNSGNKDSREKDENLNSEDPQELSREEKDEKCTLQRKELIYQESNFIEEILSPEEPSGSSGFFSSCSPNENDPPLAENETSNDFVENKYENHKNKLSDLYKSLEKECTTDDREHDFLESVSMEIDESESLRTRSQSLQCNLFKWANTKETQKANMRKPFVKSKSSVTPKRIIKRIPSQGKSLNLDSQQSLLQKFGFQKKTALKHSVDTMKD